MPRRSSHRWMPRGEFAPWSASTGTAVTPPLLPHVVIGLAAGPSCNRGVSHASRSVRALARRLPSTRSRRRGPPRTARRVRRRRRTALGRRRRSGDRASLRPWLDVGGKNPSGSGFRTPSATSTVAATAAAMPSEIHTSARRCRRGRAVLPPVSGTGRSPSVSRSSGVAAASPGGRASGRRPAQAAAIAGARDGGFRLGWPKREPSGQLEETRGGGARAGH